MHGHDVEQRFSQIRRAAFCGPAAAGALADAGKGPVTDNTVTVGEILLRHAGFVKKMGLDAPYLGKSSAHGELKKRMPSSLTAAGPSAAPRLTPT